MTVRYPLDAYVGELTRPLYTVPCGLEATHPAIEAEWIQAHKNTRDTCPYQKSFEEGKEAAEAETQPAYICVDSSIPPGQHTQEKGNSIMKDGAEQVTEGGRRVITKMGARDGDNDDDMADEAL